MTLASLQAFASGFHCGASMTLQFSGTGYFSSSVFISGSGSPTFIISAIRTASPSFTGGANDFSVITRVPRYFSMSGVGAAAKGGVVASLITARLGRMGDLLRERRF